MSVSAKFIPKAVEELEEIRNSNEMVIYNRRNEILSKFPEYGEMTVRLAETMKTVVSAVSAKSDRASEITKKAAEENIAVQKQITELLIKNGYPADYLDPIYTCNVCKDRGVVSDGWCECVRKRACALAAKEFNEQSSLQLCSFDTFDLSLYPNKVDKVLQCPQNEMMKRIFEICKEYAENPKGGLFMVGPTGLGKTHLSLAIANRAIERDLSVVYSSVPELLRKLLDEAFGRSKGDTMSVITDCDLLILDDLGAENITDQNTSLLYQVINARSARSRPLIVNSNLDAAQVKEYYRDRITSRLFSMRVLCFCGEDNRLKIARGVR